MTKNSGKADLARNRRSQRRNRLQNCETGVVTNDTVWTLSENVEKQRITALTQLTSITQSNKCKNRDFSKNVISPFY